MPIVFDLELVADRYDAGGGQDPRRTEWPPHPARVISALRSVAESDEEADALRLLERLPAPLVHASELVWESGSRGYVVTNRVDGKGGHQTHPGRTSGLKERRSVSPRSSRVQVVWEGDVTSHDVLRLDKLAGRVPYLGRSTSPVLMSVGQPDESPAPDGLTTYSPCPRAEANAWLRVPYPGYVDELEALHTAGLPAWMASDGGRSLRGYRYGSARSEPVVEPDTSTYRDLVVLRFVGSFPEGRQVGLFTSALRSRVMSRTEDPLPPALHGHGADGIPHVAYLGLPVVGHEHADGHLVGLAVAIPRLEQPDRVRVLRGIVDAPEEHVHLRVPGLAKPVTLVYAPSETRPRAATPESWSAPSRQWVTATPIVLDRFPKVRGSCSYDDPATNEVRRSCVLAGLPEPARVTVSRHPMTPGAVALTPRDLPSRARGRLFCHARLEFDRPLRGPLLVGAGRYFGVGLLAPEVPS